MRTIPANAQVELDKRFGSEPIVLVEISWSAGSTSLYADRDIAGAAGKILDIGEIETVLALENAESAAVSLTLDDTDGSIKLGADTADVHKKPCEISLYFGDLAGTGDKIVLFKGQVSTPFEWAETERQVSFSVVSEIENFEVGFSPEEGQLDFVSQDLEGKPWPLAFGNVRHIPAQKAKQQESAKLLERFCLVDVLLYEKLKRIEQAYQIEAAMFTFWNLLRIGVHQLVPPVWWTLQEYVKVIIYEDMIGFRIFQQQATLTGLRQLARVLPLSVPIRVLIIVAENNLNVLARISQMIQNRKAWLEEVTQMTCWAFDMEKKAMQKMIEAYGRMRQLYGQYLETQQEICLQFQCYKEEVLVEDEDVFPDGTPVDIRIKNVKFRVQFNHTTHKMKFLVGPLENEINPPIQAWKPDDEPCHQITEMDGMDLIWLAENPPPNLDGQYLLVKKRGGDEDTRHIVKVIRQDGQKVYFELVEWDQGNTSGSPRGQSLDTVINGIVSPPGGWVLGPFGTMVPRGLFTGGLDPNIWGTPEAALLMQILSMIPGGVNEQELKILATLVYKLPFDQMAGVILAFPEPRDVFTIIGPDIEKIEAASGMIPWYWLDRWDIPYEQLPKSLFFEVEPGTPIVPDGPACEIFIANILPSTIKSVMAYRTNREGNRYLAPIPSSYYIKNEAANLGSYTVTALTFPVPIQDIPEEGWESEIYVTLNSSVGPNPVDVIQWIAETYTNKTIDAASFADVHGKVAKYPVHFCLFDRPDALSEIQRIAWEARIGVILRNDEFVLKYLSERPTKDLTFADQDIEQNGLTVEYSQTESLVTRLVAEFHEDYLPLRGNDKPPRVVLRHNIKKYGMHHRDEDMHTLVHRDTVRKSATFWLIRGANTWKKLKVQTFIKNIALEIFDTVELDLSTPFQDHFSEEGMLLSFVERATYNPSDHTVNLILHLPIKTGEMTEYTYFWPALESPTEWPPAEEIEEGFAGGYGPGSGVTGTIDDCPE